MSHSANLENALLFFNPEVVIKSGLLKTLKYPIPVWFLLKFAYSNDNNIAELVIKSYN